jgi:hypothetical protein
VRAASRLDNPADSRRARPNAGFERAHVLRDSSADPSAEECPMFVIREILNCKPGKVRPMVEKFRVLSNALEELGQEPLRLLTDVSGEPFWTLIAEVKIERIDDFFAFEQKLFANETVRRAMADYHDHVATGRREIYRVES